MTWSGRQVFPEAQKPGEQTGMKTAESRVSRSLRSTGSWAATMPNRHHLPQVLPLGFFLSPAIPQGLSSWRAREFRWSTCSMALKIRLQSVAIPPPTYSASTPKPRGVTGHGYQAAWGRRFRLVCPWPSWLLPSRAAWLELLK